MEDCVTLIGDSPAVRELGEDVELAIEVDTPILLTGEAGVGKQQLARWIHHRSARCAAPFLAFHGGSQDVAMDAGDDDVFYAAATASGGTLYLREIGNAPDAIRRDVMTLLSQSARRTPGHPTRPHSGVRILAGTKGALFDQGVDNRCDEALFYRLNTIHLRIPALRERRADIPPLVHHLLRQHAAVAGIWAPDVAPDAMHCLTTYEWSGNLRELESVTEQIIASVPLGISIRPWHLPTAVTRQVRDARRSVTVNVSVLDASAVSARDRFLDFQSEADDSEPAPPTAAEGSLSRAESTLTTDSFGSAGASAPATVALPQPPAHEPAVTQPRHVHSAGVHRNVVGRTSAVQDARRQAQQQARNRRARILGAMQGRRPGTSIAPLVASVAAFVCGIALGASLMVIERGTADNDAVGSPDTVTTDGFSPALAPSPAGRGLLPAARVQTATYQERPGLAPASPETLTDGRTSFRGSLRIDSRPLGAHVYINNREVGVTPIVLRDLPVGSRAVRLEMDAYERWSSVIQVVTDQRSNVSAELLPKQAARLQLLP